MKLGFEGLLPGVVSLARLMLFISGKCLVELRETGGNGQRARLRAPVASSVTRVAAAFRESGEEVTGLVKQAETRSASLKEKAGAGCSRTPCHPHCSTSLTSAIK